MARQLEKYKKEVKVVSKRLTIQHDDLKLFNNIKARLDTLAGVGVSEKQLTIGFNVAISDEANSPLATALLKLSRNLNNKDVKETKQGKRKSSWGYMYRNSKEKLHGILSSPIWPVMKGRCRMQSATMKSVRKGMHKADA